MADRMTGVLTMMMTTLCDDDDKYDDTSLADDDIHDPAHSVPGCVLSPHDAAVMTTLITIPMTSMMTMMMQLG